MKPSVAILLLLFGNALASAAENCLQLPDVPNARLQDRKNAYEKGDTIRFNCDVGYTGRQIRYVCTDNGWRKLYEATCRLKPCVLPDDIPNGYYEIIKGEDYVFGTTIQYVCNEGYQMVSKEDTRTCLINDWSNHLPVCEPLSCDAPPPVPGVTVEGLPMNDRPILPDRFLTFSCDVPGSTLNGSETLVCGKDGKWNNPFPNCVNGSHVTKDPGSCGSPPPLDNGDFIASTTQFKQNTRVDYQCQSKYVMQGEPYKTCLNGVWTGEITCLKPCTINPDLMIPNKIKFKYKRDNKLYAPHDDHITFACISGATPDNDMDMRQKCVDGVMILPRCV